MPIPVPGCFTKYEGALMKHNRRQPKKRTSPSLLKQINVVAGIDCGSAEHFVAVPPERDPKPIRSFRSFTADLHRLADWLATCGVTSIAMESTGVYWIALKSSKPVASRSSWSTRATTQERCQRLRMAPGVQAQRGVAPRKLSTRSSHHRPSWLPPPPRDSRSECGNCA